MEITSELAYAVRVAKSMWNDPEAESAAGEALARANATYDGSVPRKRWIALCVRRQVWFEWRKMRDRHSTVTESVDILDFDTEEIPVQVPREDWELLVSHYIEREYIDVIARRMRVSVYKVRLLLERAVERFLSTRW